MPLYEYWCKSCEDIFEELKLLSDTGGVKCPECGKDSERIMSSFYGIVKGSEHRPLDCVIGEDSDKKWEAMSSRKANRIAKMKAGNSGG